MTSASGSTARTSVPSPGGLVTLSEPSQRADPVAQAAQPGAGAGPRAADAVVAHLDHERAVLARDAHASRGVARAYFATLVSASETVK